MPPVVNTEWLNENSLRNYPFRENARLIPVDTDGALLADVRLPNYLVVDFVITMPGPTIPDVYLAQFARVGNLATFTFTDSNDIIVSTLAVDTNQHSKNDAYGIVGTGTYSDVRGRVVLGDLNTLFTDLAEGLFNFTQADAAFEAAVVRPDLRGVRSLQVDQGGALSDYLFGHVKLVEGTNIRLTHLPEYNAIRIDAINGAGLNQECDCDDPLEDQCVTQLNGIPLDDLEIIGDGCVKVQVSGNTIVISDTCSEPCCGCPELEFLTENLKVLSATVSTLETYAHELSAKIHQFVTSFVLTVQGQ
jgi:hypothetical protein